MVTANDAADAPLDTIEIAGLPLDLMVAGHVTVTRAIGSTLHRMFAEPVLREHLLDPELCPKAIEEILRLESPAQGLFRVTTREVELGGATLPEGARVMAHFASANRDACVFADAEVLRPERDDIGSHLAFGKGIHFCIGAPLGRLELRVALPMLLRRLPRLRPGPRPPVREPVVLRARLHVARCRMGSVSDVVIVTGAASGLGAVYCRELAAAGYAVVGADIEPVEGVDLGVGVDVWTARRPSGWPRPSSSGSGASTRS